MGQDKASTVFNGKPLVQWSIDALTPLCTEILVCSNNPEHTFKNTKRIEDAPNVFGPLAGLLSGLKASKTQLNLVLACDTPNVTTEVLQEMLQTIKQQDAIIFTTSNGKIHPLIGCYKTDILNHILTVLQSNRHSMMHLLELIQYIPYTSDNDDLALNVNSKNQLQ